MYVYIYAYPPLYPGSCYPMGGITSSSEMPPSVCDFCKYVDLSIYEYTHMSMYVYIIIPLPPCIQARATPWVASPLPPRCRRNVFLRASRSSTCCKS